MWNAWTDKGSRVVHESYTMLTLHANSHPLMSRIHKPDLNPEAKLPLPFELQNVVLDQNQAHPQAVTDLCYAVVDDASHMIGSQL